MKQRKDFDSTKEYIEYLIFKENILNPKNILLLLIIIGSIAMISLQFNTFFQPKSGIENVQVGIKEMQDALIKAGYSQEEVLKLNEDELNSLYSKVILNNKGQEAGNRKYQEYPEQEAYLLKQDYYLKASTGDFESIVNDFEDKKLKYFFSESYNKELITIYNDAYYLRNIIGIKSQANQFNVKETLRNIKDPQMLLYGILLSEEKHRRDTFIDNFSLSPVLLKKQVTVNSTFSTSMPSIHELDKDKKDSRFFEIAQYLHEGDYTFYKIGFTIDNNNLTAYIYKNMDNFNLSCYGIYSNSDDHPYLRVYDFLKMENNNTVNNSSSNNNSHNNTPTVNTEEDNVQEDNSLIDNPNTDFNNTENIPTEENQENSTMTNEEFNLD